MRTQKIYCPMVDGDCPYYQHGECALENPEWDCDDFASCYDEDELNGKDYLTDEMRTAFEEDE